MAKELVTGKKNIEKLGKLVEGFRQNIKELKNTDYDESNVRVDFIDKFFEILGWDVRNDEGATQEFREVIREDTVEVAGKPKAPDYGFMIGGKKIFFVEAKKPSIDIKDAIEPAYQVRRYGYSAKLPISVLTDFEQLAIYDTRIKPHKNDKAGVARVFYCHFEDYEKNFETICGVLSKEAIKKGSLNKYLDEAQVKRGTSEIDKEFLELIEDWRIHLAKNLALRNKKITIQSLNYAVQKIIDRIIFLRIAEDRGVENYGNLLAIAKEKDIHQSLNDYFIKADKKYNGEFFKQDSVLNLLKIDKDVFGDIINSLYYPDCPYELSVLPIEILGSIYECFLGKTIHLTASHQARIEDKPEVKKAGGVYYTPQYIVDYIVMNTVGEKIKGKTPKEIEKIKILDPACGSGSFLIGTYSYFLNYHLQYYKNNPENLKKALKDNKLYRVKDNYLLTIQEKQHILLNNIYGVDIDTQAVEVTKLSLLLKLMEGESQESTGSLFRYSEIKLLPNLSSNIKRGNSLIGSDFYKDKQMSLFGNDEIRKVNVFDWKENFAEVFQSDGFDVVIGNPPYFNIETLGAKSPEAEYIMTRYKSVWMDKSDILFYFIAKAIEVCKGEISFIISNAFLFANKAQNLRNFILENTSISEIINFERFQVFEDASITTAVIKLTKQKTGYKTNAIVFRDKVYEINDIVHELDTKQHAFKVQLNKNEVFALINSSIDALNKKIDGAHKKLGDILFVGKGMETATNDVFLFETPPKNFPKDYIKKRMSGEIIERYYTGTAIEHLLYFEDVELFDKLPKAIQNYLSDNKERLKNRADKKRRKTAKWWNYSFPLHKEYYHLPKIWCSYRSKDNTFILDETDEYIGLTNTTAIFGTDESIPLKYILALLNSKVLNFRYKSIGKQTGSGIFEYFENQISKLPIPLPNSFHVIINLVDQMLAVQKEFHAAKESDKPIVQQKIDAIDRQIDALVYELYGLTEDEIKTVEGKT